MGTSRWVSEVCTIRHAPHSLSALRNGAEALRVSQRRGEGPTQVGKRSGLVWLLTVVGQALFLLLLPSLRFNSGLRQCVEHRLFNTIAEPCSRSQGPLDLLASPLSCDRSAALGINLSPHGDGWTRKSSGQGARCPGLSGPAQPTCPGSPSVK